MHFIFVDLQYSQNEIATNCQQFEALHFLFVFAIQHVFPSVIMFHTEVIRSWSLHLPMRSWPEFLNVSSLQVSFCRQRVSWYFRNRFHLCGHPWYPGDCQCNNYMHKNPIIDVGIAEIDNAMGQCNRRTILTWDCGINGKWWYFSTPVTILFHPGVMWTTQTLAATQNLAQMGLHITGHVRLALVKHIGHFQNVLQINCNSITDLLQSRQGHTLHLLMWENSPEWIYQPNMQMEVKQGMWPP